MPTHQLVQELEPKWIVHTRRWTPSDLNFSNRTWSRAGTASNDIVCAEMRVFSGYAIADAAWSIKVSVYDELATTVIWTSGIVGSDVGVAGGQTQPLHFMFGPFSVHGYYRIRFLGQAVGGAASVTGGFLRVYGRAV